MLDILLSSVGVTVAICFGAIALVILFNLGKLAVYILVDFFKVLQDMPGWWLVFLGFVLLLLFRL